MKYLLPELRKSFRWPRWTAIWPLNADLRSLHGHWRMIGKLDDSWYERFLPRFPHEYLSEVLKDINMRLGDDSRVPQDDLRLVFSVLNYYARFEQLPEKVRESTRRLQSELVSHLEVLNATKLPADLVADAFQTLEFIGITSTDTEVRDRANRLLVQIARSRRQD